MASFAKIVGLAAVAVLLRTGSASAGPLDEMSVERWAKLREAERFQLNIAEKYYRENQFKVAGDEYEKFLKLYEKSEGAPYAQLKWSHCQVLQRQQNTAIKDGYQTLLDYFPESPEAPVAALLIGRTFKDIGDIKAAKKGYAKAIQTFPKHFASVMARFDLVEIAEKEKDAAARTTLLRELTYDVERKGPAANDCAAASRLLTQHYFTLGDFEEGRKALATSHKDEDLPYLFTHPSYGNILNILAALTGAMEEPTKKLGEKLAEAAAVWLKTQAVEGLKDEKKKEKAVAAWYYIGDVRRAAKQPDKEKEVYDQIAAALGKDDTVLGRQAQWCKENGKKIEARALYGQFKNQIEGQNQIALSYMQDTPPQFDQAATIYRKLSVQEPKEAPKWLQAVAQVYRRANKIDLAVGVYRELITTDVANTNAYNLMIADTYYHAHRWAECVTQYRASTCAANDTFQMAYAQRQLKKFDEAIILYQQIMVTSPGSASSALYAIGTTHEEANRAEAAIKVFKQVCDKFPTTSEGSRAHSHLNDKYKITVTLGGAKN